MIPIKKYEDIKARIQKEKGGLDFFGLILREDAPGVWDLVVSAPWAEADEWSALRYLSEMLRTELEPQELLQLSRIVILEKGSPVFKALISAPRTTGNSVTELHNSSAGDIYFRHAYILAA
jgi:hypothetical protein